ncbi:MAG: GH1 family beta-glucosidase [Alphaproteobacteria bacterium]|nr:GH1 family beta-glucosidase [Alphaproteobacteria bacterium]MDA8000340.1 GH1 family beta-glucosidase [Alphaproteobacteria bacterium]MDA8004826.1 GH1 family beta-glucosidase [Alphaproteobacteria bacterium]MDA8005713.1 GH1 family beta-glucosidase [Alphaproteobacteria bacterium]MDA8013065.1 GH1 family beta-glucosidase [Alphaproteobacteria bacterium]
MPPRQDTTPRLPPRGAFPDDFVFGAATSSYQIEGSGFGGCGRSHWDDFAAAGNTRDGADGSVACAHILHWERDLDLVKNAGFDAYRFSFSWPRIQPAGRGALNAEGVSFYDRLIDGMLSRGLLPFASLYHWDLPSSLAVAGGWRERDTAYRFGDFTDIVMRHFGDRLHSVATINEPWCAAWLSHYWGEHAPGMRDLVATARAMHYILLAHGVSLSVMRDYGHGNLGIVLNKEYGEPADGREETLTATRLFDGIYNRWFEEAIFLGHYPADVLALFGAAMPEGYESDMALISARLDWAGVNYYTRSVIELDADESCVGFRCIRGDLEKTAMGWEVYPEGLGFFLRRLSGEYAPGLPLYVTENGMSRDDTVVDGEVCDVERVDFLGRHLGEVLGLLSEGVLVRGYFAWSLLDNYEWSLGYSQRFGLVHVDFADQARLPKLSWHKFREMLNSN